MNENENENENNKSKSIIYKDIFKITIDGILEIHRTAANILLQQT